MNTKTTSEKLNFIKKIVLNYKNSKDCPEIAIWCPYCENSNKNKLKMIVNVDKNLYHCFVCDTKGRSIPYLVKKLSEKYYSESKNYFLDNSNQIKDEWLDILNQLDDNEEKQEEAEKVEIPEGFMFCALNLNSIDPDIRDVCNYAINRGCDDHKMWLLRLGVSNHPNFRRSLIIPSFDENGIINFYTCRKIDAPTTDMYKYINCNASRVKIIFNDLSINWKKPLTIVEGPLDLLKTNDNATCLLGSSLPKDSALFKKIVKNGTPVILALDKDAISKTLKIADDLMKYNIEVSLMDTTLEKDVGDMSHEMFDNLYQNSCKLDTSSLLLNKISLI